MAQIINIGLDKLSPRVALEALTSRGFPVYSKALYWTFDEPSLVIETSVTYADAYRLAEALGEDCIAVWYPDDQEGFLAGPKAEAWGAFNPSYFILPNGLILGYLPC